MNAVMTRSYFKSLSSVSMTVAMKLFYFHAMKYKNMSEDQQKLAKKLIFDALSMSDMEDLTREHQILRVEGSDKLMV